jgi:hypothetical protein
VVPTGHSPAVEGAAGRRPGAATLTLQVLGKTKQVGLKSRTHADEGFAE